MTAANTRPISRLLTAEEYARQADASLNTELVRGRIVVMNMPFPGHGAIAARISYLLSRFLEGRAMGRVVSNDSGVVTERNPDTVRGADVAYYSFARWPKTGDQWVYPANPPEIVFEVRSPSDRTPKVLRKVDEYLDAGVVVVCVVDGQAGTVTIFRSDRDEKQLTARQKLVFPDVLPGFAVPVAKIFE